MTLLRLVLVSISVRVVISVNLLRREEAGIDASNDVGERLDTLELLEKAYGGSDKFYAVQTGLFGDEGEDKQLLSHADSWIEGGQALSPGIYGEILPAGMLKMLRVASARPGEVFMDLGSGAGKFPVMASKIRGMRAKGIELIPRRHKAGCEALKKLDELLLAPHGGGDGTAAPMGSVQLVQGSFFDYDISDADVIFMDSVEWSPDMMKQLGEMCQGLKPGSRIFTWKELPGESFVHESSVLVPVSWSKEGNEWQLYRKVGDANKTALLGKTALLTQAEGGPVSKASCDS